jgi:hypothetical protein
MNSTVMPDTSSLHGDDRSPQPLSHPRQRNTTRMVVHGGITAVEKKYRWLSRDQVLQRIEIEDLARAIGVPIPRRLALTDDGRTVHAWVPGRHVTDPTPAQTTAAARAFALHLAALDGHRPSWALTRPARLPRHAAAAIMGTPASVRELVLASWARLAHEATGAVTTCSHLDWRADNLLWDGNRLVAVVDWEDIGLLPAPETVGYAAVAHTHSWRDDLYTPVRFEPIHRFLQASLAAGALRTVQIPHAATAIQFAAAVRLAEDHRRGVAEKTAADLDTFTGNLRMRSLDPGSPG